MSARNPEEIAAEMAQHYLRLGTLWAEWARANGKVRPKTISREEKVRELKRRLDRKVRRGE